MGETLLHTRLVSIIVSCITRDHLLNPGLCLYCDNPTVLHTEKPPPIDGFYPDVYAATTPPKVTILGEAKTIPDIDTERTFNQLVAFLGFLSVRPGPTFIMATPRQAMATAKNLIRLAKRKAGAKDVPVAYLTEAEGLC